MSSLFKKSLNLIMKNPYVILLLVIYLVIVASAFPVLILKAGVLAFILLILLTSAFFAGWFGMIKFVVSYKETGNDEEDMKNQFSAFKNEFFSSIPSYILPLIFYILIFVGITVAILVGADKFIGHDNELLNQVAAMAGNQDVLYNFITTLPDEAKLVIVKRCIFIYSCFILYFYLTFYSIPALYFQKTSNPVLGLINGLIALIKKPFLSIGLFILILISNILLTFIEAICAYYSSALMFITFVLRIYFAAFIVVLIFSVYEKYFADNCDNGTDSIGQDESCN